MIVSFGFSRISNQINHYSEGTCSILLVAALALLETRLSNKKFLFWLCHAN